HCRIAAQLPWWDSEVANAALLSSAAMQCGYASLVESTGTKDGRGRSDLWVQFGPEQIDGANEEFVELKTALCDGLVTTEGLDAAVADARAVSLPSRARIGACIYKIVS